MAPGLPLYGNSLSVDRPRRCQFIDAEAATHPTYFRQLPSCT
jgi:hypothetical protein